jgi:hypothetical protein
MKKPFTKNYSDPSTRTFMMYITNKVQIRFYNEPLAAVNKHKSSMPLGTSFEQNLTSQIKTIKYIKKQLDNVITFFF